EMLQRCGAGFGAVALSAVWAEEGRAVGSDADPFQPRPSHFPAKAKNIIFLYMDGGPSQVDTFDPKPLLAKMNGKPYPGAVAPTQFNNVGTLLACPWKFRQYGESGIPVSDLFPNVARCVDDLAVVRSMTSNFSEHTNANYFLHTGFGMQGRPSMGSWATYGLGSECRDLPGFVVVNGGLIPPGGVENFSNGFLAATHQASIFKPANPPVANIKPTEATSAAQRAKLKLMAGLDEQSAARFGRDDQWESAVRNYEMAFRMQSAAPDVVDFASETRETQALYGLDAEYGPTKTFAAECLLARRLVERGVRFVELTCPSTGHDRWDQHSGLKKGHEDNARAVDQPIAALLVDLKRRGLLEETLVVWAGEFGRTPFAQGTDGRDHNPFGFTIWLAGGGVRGGAIVGATDEFGYKAVENRCEIHDLHATLLHLLGIDHTKLTYRFSGRDMRLTDVHGRVVKEVLA
ncbi:MAG: DUF1501 domain-containing protein, partial [Planctomycetia bacterium]